MLTKIVKKSQSGIKSGISVFILFLFLVITWSILGRDFYQQSKWTNDVCKIENITQSEPLICVSQSDSESPVSSFPCILLQYSGMTQNEFFKQPFLVYKICKPVDTKCVYKYNVNEMLDCRYSGNEWNFGDNVFYNEGLLISTIIASCIFVLLILKFFICNGCCRVYIERIKNIQTS